MKPKSKKQKVIKAWAFKHSMGHLAKLDDFETYEIKSKKPEMVDKEGGWKIVRIEIKLLSFLLLCLLAVQGVL